MHRRYKARSKDCTLHDGIRKKRESWGNMEEKSRLQQRKSGEHRSPFANKGESQQVVALPSPADNDKEGSPGLVSNMSRAQRAPLSAFLPPPHSSSQTVATDEAFGPLKSELTEAVKEEQTQTDEANEQDQGRAVKEDAGAGRARGRRNQDKGKRRCEHGTVEKYWQGLWRLRNVHTWEAEAILQ